MAVKEVFEGLLEAVRQLKKCTVSYRKVTTLKNNDPAFIHDDSKDDNKIKQRKDLKKELESLKQHVDIITHLAKNEIAADSFLRDAIKNTYRYLETLINLMTDVEKNANKWLQESLASLSAVITRITHIAVEISKVYINNTIKNHPTKVENTNQVISERIKLITPRIEGVERTLNTNIKPLQKLELIEPLLTFLFEQLEVLKKAGWTVSDEDFKNDLEELRQSILAEFKKGGKYHGYNKNLKNFKELEETANKKIDKLELEELQKANEDLRTLNSAAAAEYAELRRDALQLKENIKTFLAEAKKLPLEGKGKNVNQFKKNLEILEEFVGSPENEGSFHDYVIDAKKLIGKSEREKVDEAFEEAKGLLHPLKLAADKKGPALWTFDKPKEILEKLENARIRDKETKIVRTLTPPEKAEKLYNDWVLPNPNMVSAEVKAKQLKTFVQVLQMLIDQLHAEAVEIYNQDGEAREKVIKMLRDRLKESEESKFRWKIKGIVDNIEKREIDGIVIEEDEKGNKKEKETELPREILKLYLHNWGKGWKDKDFFNNGKKNYKKPYYDKFIEILDEIIKGKHSKDDIFYPPEELKTDAGSILSLDSMKKVTDEDTLFFIQGEVISRNRSVKEDDCADGKFSISGIIGEIKKAHSFEQQDVSVNKYLIETDLGRIKVLEKLFYNFYFRTVNSWIYNYYATIHGENGLKSLFERRQKLRAVTKITLRRKKRKSKYKKIPMSAINRDYEPGEVIKPKTNSEIFLQKLLDRDLPQRHKIDSLSMSQLQQAASKVGKEKLDLLPAKVKLGVGQILEEHECDQIKKILKIKLETEQILTNADVEEIELKIENEDTRPTVDDDKEIETSLVYAALYTEAKTKLLMQLIAEEFGKVFPGGNPNKKLEADLTKLQEAKSTAKEKRIRKYGVYDVREFVKSILSEMNNMYLKKSNDWTWAFKDDLLKPKNAMWTDETKDTKVTLTYGKVTKTKSIRELLSKPQFFSEEKELQGQFNQDIDFKIELLSNFLTTMAEGLIQSGTFKLEKLEYWT